MKNIIKLISILLVSTVITNCNKRYDMEFYSEYKVDCNTVREKVALYRKQKAEARANDRFKFKYMLVLPAIYETIKMNYQEAQADKKLREYDALASQMKCFSNNQVGQYNGYTPQQQAANYPYGNARQQGQYGSSAYYDNGYGIAAEHYPLQQQYQRQAPQQYNQGAYQGGYNNGVAVRNYRNSQQPQQYPARGQNGQYNNPYAAMNGNNVGSGDPVLDEMRRYRF